MQDSSGDPAPPPCLQMAALWHTPTLGGPRCPSDQAGSGHLLEFALGFLLACVPLVEGKVSVWVCTHTHVHTRTCTHTRAHTHPPWAAFRRQPQWPQRELQSEGRPRTAAAAVQCRGPELALQGRSPWPPRGTSGLQAGCPAVQAQTHRRHALMLSAPRAHACTHASSLSAQIPTLPCLSLSSQASTLL